ncbi:hypothetical protein GCM10009549_36900 [Streptomyces thermoalcalitolerans]|uniref:Uncharacterized protein n=1 Tax=Streptomyces thermoalcalitolerans TaxID=65605 RepID=A0ABP3ZBF2_9ACTN
MGSVQRHDGIAQKPPGVLKVGDVVQLDAGHASDPHSVFAHLSTFRLELPFDDAAPESTASSSCASKWLSGRRLPVGSPLDRLLLRNRPPHRGNRL